MVRTAALIVAAWTCASAAFAQAPPPTPDTSWAERMMDRPRQLGLEAELNALDARLRSEQNLAALQAQSQPPRLPPSPEAPNVIPPLSPVAQPIWPSIPEAALAASRARIEAILAERR